MITKNVFNEQCITYSQMNLIYNSRIMWRRFTTWIRAYIVSRYVGIGTAEESFERLYLEAEEFGDMLRIIFGRRAASSFNQLMTQYIIGLRDLITAKLQGDDAAVQQNVDRLYGNIRERAAFLSSINPYLDEYEWQRMLERYFQYTIEMANSFISGNFSNDIRSFDQLTALTDKMGDIFAQALYYYITSGSQNTGNPPAQYGQQCITASQMNAIYNIRMFWFELSTWIRAYMLSRYKGVGNEAQILVRLKQVPVNYTNQLKQFFGEKNVERDLQLINSHIDLITALITAQMAGNTEEINRITQELYRNADERAAFLASINPFWDENEWRRRLYGKLQATINELITFQTGDFARNLDIFSKLLDQAEETSSYYMQGLVDYITSVGLS